MNSIAYRLFFSFILLFIIWDNIFIIVEEESLDSNEANEITSKNWSNDVLPYCSRNDVKDGEWKRIVLEEPPYYPFNYSDRSWVNNAYACVNNSSQYKQPFKTYKWVPRKESCQFNEWNTSEFCSVIQKYNSKYNISFTTMAFVGDSLTYENYCAFAFSLGFGAPLLGHLTSRRQNRNLENFACPNNTLKILFRRSDYLSHIPDIIQKDNPHIFVVNKGAHYTPNTAFAQTLNETIYALEQWQSAMADNTNNTSDFRKLFVRTTVPGVTKCENFNHPTNNLTEMEAYVANITNYRNRKEIGFNWFRFKESNQIMLDMFQSSSLNYTVLDAYEINLLRPDGHVHVGDNHDCLHSCIPGSPDVYNQLLFHYLSRDLYETFSDIEEA